MKKVMRPTQFEAGFTLIEVVIVVAIVGILASIAIVNMIGWRAERQMQGAGRGFVADMQRARITAIREAETVSVVLNPGAGGSYSVFLDTDQDYTLDAGEDEVASVTLPPTVTMKDVTLAGNRTQFNARGMVPSTGKCTFEISNGKNIEVEISTIGNISIAK